MIKKQKRVSKKQARNKIETRRRRKKMRGGFIPVEFSGFHRLLVMFSDAEPSDHVARAEFLQLFSRFLQSRRVGIGFDRDVLMNAIANVSRNPQFPHYNKIKNLYEEFIANGNYTYQQNYGV
jgi:tRNA(Ser,Leu) C12 N-acetylase TAN1